MKKVLLFTAMIFSIALSMDAKTIPQWSAFLSKLNLYYYSFPRQGVKNYQCHMHFAFQESSLNKLRSHFSSKPDKVDILNKLEYIFTMRDGNGELNSHYAAKTGDTYFDERFKYLVDTGMEFFEKTSRSLAFQEGFPQFDDKEVAEKNYQVVNLAQGFNVIKTEDKKTWTYSFNQQAMLTGMVFVDDGKVRQTIKTFFLQTPQGMVVSELTNEETYKKMIINLKIKYQDVEGYHFPSVVDYREHLYNQKPGTDDFITQITFDNFRVNVDLPPRLEIHF